MISLQNHPIISVIGKIAIGVMIGMITHQEHNHLLLSNLPSPPLQILIHGGIGCKEIVNGIGIIVGHLLNQHPHQRKVIGGILGTLKVPVVHGGALEQACGM